MPSINILTSALAEIVIIITTIIIIIIITIIITTIIIIIIIIVIIIKVLNTRPTAHTSSAGVNRP